MSRFSASVATTGLALLLFAVAVPAQTQTQLQTEAQPQPQPQTQTQPQAQPQTQPTLSKVRIVRVSEVRGAAQLDRGVGDGYESAITNMPVVQQNRLKTEMGVAEVEFEDNSTLRLGPYSEVDFTLLGRTAQGATVSTMRLVKGIAYMSVVKSRAKVPNALDLVFGDQNIQLQPGTHVRLEMNGQQAKLAVLKGTVQVDGPKGAVDVSHKRTATFALAADTPPLVAKGIEAESLLDSDSQSRLDLWDKQLDEYHSRRASLSNFGGVPYSYGASDMLYYGAFQDMGGCGTMWRPYFASAAWSPYANGTWAYYAGAGYSWVSPYPWGWTPYHYGSWSFCPGTGWGWMPGGSWMGLNNISSASMAARSGIKVAGRPPVIAPLPPRVGRRPSLVSVNKTALVHSGMDPEGAFVFRKDSAGLGIPRNQLGKLKGFSKNTMQRGIARTPIYMSGAPRPTNGMRGERNAVGPATIRRGNAPSERGLSNTRPSVNLGSAPRGAIGNSAPMRSAPLMGPAPSMRSAPAMGAPAPAGGGRAH
jgi:hypothetical protein